MTEMPRRCAPAAASLDGSSSVRVVMMLPQNDREVSRLWLYAVKPALASRCACSLLEHAEGYAPA